MRRLGVWLVAGLVVVGMVEARLPAEGASGAEGMFDRFGGWRQTRTAATGWFRTAIAEGRWWLVDPAGHRFLSVGVNNVNFRPDVIRGTDRSPYNETVKREYRHESEWAQVAVRRLRGWGFNTVGAWSAQLTWEQGMPYTVILNCADLVSWGEGKSFPDVFDPAFEQAVARYARRTCGPLASDPALIGYFTDNELWWGHEEGGSETLLAEFLGREHSAPGRQALGWFLERRYLNIAELNEAWGTEYGSFAEVGRMPQVGSRIPEEDVVDFQELVAERYFRVTHDAIREVDEHHLMLGCRFAGDAPRAVLEAMGPHADVVSVNHYDVHPPAEMLREIHRVTGLPVMVTEFSFRARDSGLPNTRGAGIVVDTQEERATYFERYVGELMGLPMVVGYHWFEHSDQPAEGRFDGEDSNYGVVDIRDEAYTALVEVMERVNDSVYHLATKQAGAGEGG